MKKKKMPNSIRKYIRKEKARIRREILDIKKQEEMINKIYDKLKCDTNIRMHANDANKK